MRIALLTSDDLPAVRCAQVLADAHELAAVLVRGGPPAVPFETAHPLDDRQQEFEATAWFAGNPPPLMDMATVTRLPNLACDAADTALLAAQPEAVVAFNAGRIGKTIIDRIGRRAIALHYGNPQEYRGEDIHFWAAYHGEIAELEGVVQYATPSPNTGAMLFSRRLDPAPDMKLHEVRKAVTDICLEGALKVLSFFEEGGLLSINQLQRLGKLYGPMPSVLKEFCASRHAAGPGIG